MALLGNLTGSSQYFNDRVFYNGVATQSLRFDNARNSFLNRTPSIAGNQKTWTWSGWVKRNNSSSPLFRSINASGFVLLRFLSDQINLLWFSSNTAQWSVTTNALYRDFSAWYHIVVAFDTTQGTASNRVKIYVNGVQETSLATASYPNQNHDSLVNQTLVHSFATTGALDAYMAEVNFVDGTALDPTYFGETKNGVWIAKKYTGSYGTNGFRLQFNQTGVGSGSSSTIGADTSGQNNHWTSSGIVASDCNMPDSPENNFCTLNSLIVTPQTTFSEGNLFANLGATHKTVHGTFGMTTGKWYWEARAFDGGANKFTYGLTDTRNISNLQVSGTNYLLANSSNTYANGDAVSIYNGALYKNGSATSSYDTAVVDNDIVGIAFDADAGKVWFHREGTWINGSATASTTINLSNHDTTVTTGQTYHIAFAGETSDWLLNAGQDSSFTGTETAQGNTDAKGIGDFYYAPPSGFLALCTANLPEPTIGPNSLTQADDYFNTVLYTGSGSSPNAITGVGFQPDWVWIKNRTATVSHAIFDSSRGVTSAGATNKAIGSDRTDVEGNGNGGLSAFGSDGFTLVDGSSGSYPRSLVNDATTYVSWNWKANGGTTSSNTDGSITSTVQANTTAGFSIVTYTGTGSNATVGHGLGVEPSLVLLKNRDSTTHWISYWKPLGNTERMIFTSGAVASDANAWNNTTPTSTVFSLGSGAQSNSSSDDYVGYIFSEVEGYSKISVYYPNNTTDNAFVYTGFKPAMVILKGAEINNQEWGILDNKRPGYNSVYFLQPQSTAAESTGNIVDFLSNGFKIRETGGVGYLTSKYIYMAFAEAPFKYANAG